MHEVQDQGAMWLFFLQNILDRLRAAAFQAAAWVYPGASPYMYPARTTSGHWDTLCDPH